MERNAIAPRDQWQALVESRGLHFHTVEGKPYWDESAYYSFTAGEIDVLEKATYDLNEMCLAAVQHIIDRDLFGTFQVPAEFVPWVKESWERDENTVYGRFDLAYRPDRPPRLLEYNADTPTALLEAAVIQWYWLKDRFPDADQFNSIHERLLEIFGVLRGQMTDRFYFAALRGDAEEFVNVEDFMTVNYLRDVAMQAGFEPTPGTAYIHIEDIGWDAQRRVFTDLEEQEIRNIFKLYPWEWLVREEFGPHLLEAATRWLEPPWKMLLSNKALLPVLWRLYGADEGKRDLLLPAFFTEEELLEDGARSYVRKPLLSREGANVRVVEDGRTVLETEGPYGDGPWVYQELYDLPDFDGNYPVLGSWIVNGWACGLGIREDRTRVTQNTSRFVPHLFRHG